MKKKEILLPFTKRATNKILKIIDQFLYFRFVVKYLKDLFLTKCLSISPLTNSPRKTSPVSNPVIPVSTNCYRLPTKFLHLLIMDVRSVFLDISKAFDKVWHEGLIFKLKQNDISRELRHILFDFLSNRKQRVVPNGRNSSWTNVHAGVPQGSLLGPLLFLIYINDLSDNLTSNAKLFADDTSLFSVVHDVNTSAKELNDDLKKINDWAFQ